MLRRSGLVALVALVVMLIAAGVLQAQSNRSVVGWLIADRATVQGGGLTVTGATTLADTTVTGTAALTGNLTQADGNVTVADDLNVAAQTAISVTMNAIITPTGTYQPLESAGTVNTASVAAGTAGDLLVLVNTVNTSIVLTDTGTLKLGGNRTLGQYDTLTLWSDGTNWVELSFTNN